MQETLFFSSYNRKGQSCRQFSSCYPIFDKDLLIRFQWLLFFLLVFSATTKAYFLGLFWNDCCHSLLHENLQCSVKQLCRWIIGCRLCNSMPNSNGLYAFGDLKSRASAPEKSVFYVVILIWNWQLHVEKYY